jgi:ubiquitin-conjugating enzyme E2 S
MLQALLEGPPGTPYNGGFFRVKLVLSKDYPASPPKGFFLTKIFHPNVGQQGEICVNTLKKDWKPDLGIKVPVACSNLQQSFIDSSCRRAFL